MNMGYFFLSEQWVPVILSVIYEAINLHVSLNIPLETIMLLIPVNNSELHFSLAILSLLPFQCRTTNSNSLRAIELERHRVRVTRIWDSGSFMPVWSSVSIFLGDQISGSNFRVSIRLTFKGGLVISSGWQCKLARNVEAHNTISFLLSAGHTLFWGQK